MVDTLSIGTVADLLVNGGYCRYGEVAWFVKHHDVRVNGERVTYANRILYLGDVLTVA